MIDAVVADPNRVADSGGQVGAQPLGVFGLPAGFLISASQEPDVREAIGLLIAGRRPTDWPGELEGHRLVHADDIEAARAWFARSLAADADPLDRYHLWLLDAVEADSVSPELTAEAKAVYEDLPPALAAIVPLVWAALGWPEADWGPARGQGGAEFNALFVANRGTKALFEGEPEAGIVTLTTAAQWAREQAAMPVLGAVLAGNAAMLALDLGVGMDRQAAVSELLRAASLLAQTDLADVHADLLMRAGIAHQEDAASGQGDSRSLLEAAMQCYYTALQRVTEADQPYLWAMLNLNLATAQLAVPMTQASDQLRYGIAAQALRACRRVFTAEEFPRQWSTATLNLANALVYTPSTHQGDNLVEAVGLYDELLTSGVRDEDPVGRARLLTNQGNVLAHLGIFDQARACLVEARFVFEEHLDHDAAMTVRGLLDEIAKSQVSDPELAELARRSEQMAKMPVSETPQGSGMGVRRAPRGTAADLDVVPPPKPKVTVLTPGQTHPDLPPTPRPGE